MWKHMVPQPNIYFFYLLEILVLIVSYSTCFLLMAHAIAISNEFDITVTRKVLSNWQQTGHFHTYLTYNVICLLTITHEQQKGKSSIRNKFFLTFISFIGTKILNLKGIGWTVDRILHGNDINFNLKCIKDNNSITVKVKIVNTELDLYFTNSILNLKSTGWTVH